MLILKENAANSVPTPPVGKDTFFIDDSGVPSVKNAAGSVTTFPTVLASNAQVVFLDGSSLSGENAFTYDFNNNVLNVSGNIAVGNLKTDNLLYANGTPWDLSDPGGSNTQIQFNDDESFGGSAALTFNKSSNLVTMGGALSVTGNATAGNVYANSGTVGASLLAGTLTTAAQPNITSVGTLTSLTVTNKVTAGQLQGDGGNISNVQAGNISGQVANALVAGTVYTAAQPNITSVGTLTSLDVTGNVTAGNFYANSGTIGAAQFKGDGGNLSNITSSNITGQVANALIAGTVYTNAQPNITSVGTLSSLSVTGNLTSGNANLGNLAVANFVTGTLTTAAQPNITSVGTLSSLTVSGNANIGNTETGNLTVTGSANIGGGSGGNISGANNITANTFTGTLTTNAQPNITSLGTLTGLDVNGNITAANITANTGIFTGNGSGLTALNASNLSSGTVPSARLTGAYSISVDSATTAGTVTTAAQPNITSVGTLSSLAVTGNATAGNVYANTGTIGASLLTGTLTTAAQPNITSVGTLSSLSVTGNANVGNLGTAGLIVATGNVTGGNLVTSGALSVTGNANVGNLGTAGLITATGNVSAGNLTTAGALSVTGNANVGNIGAAAGVFTGNISSLNANLGNLVTANVANLVELNVSGNANIGGGSGGNISGANNITANTFTGTLTTNAQPNITSLGTLTGLGVNGTITGVNITANTGVFTGNGSGLSALVGANVTGQVGNAAIAGTVYTNAQPNITSVGTLTSLAVSGNATAGNVYANSGTIGAANLTGTLTTAAQPNITSVGTLSSLSVTGNVAAGNLTTTGVLSVTGTGVSSIAGNLDMTSNTIINLANPTSDQDAATKFYVDQIAQGLHVHAPCYTATFNTLATLTGGTITYNNGTAGVGANLVLSGSPTANFTAANTFDGNATAIVGSRILVKNEANAAHNGIYVVDSATVMTRASDFDTPTEMAGGDFTFVQNGDNYNDTGWVMTDPVTTVGTSPVTFVQFSGAGTYTAGTGLTLTGTVFSVNASQTQITSVGTLTGLNVNGTVTASAFTANTGIFTGNGAGLTQLAGGNVTGQVANALIAGTVYTAAQPNITSVGTLTTLTVTGNVSAGNVSGTLLSGTLSTAAQPNITSLGTLTGLGVNGNITAANITANTGVFTGNGSGLSALAGGNVTGQVANALVAGTVYTAAQPNITSVGTLTSLGVSGNITAANITANTGVFTGNGSGLSAIAGGNVTGQVANALVAGTVYTAAQPNITSVGSLTGLTMSANADITLSGTASEISGANLVSASFLTGTLTTAAQPNITSVGTLTSLSVTGNISGGNLNTAGKVVASTLESNVATGTAPFAVASTTRVANLNVATAGVSDTITVTTQSSGNAFLVLGNAVTGTISETANAAFVANTSNGALYATTFVGAVSGNGAALTDLNASNISSGTLAQARLANASLTVNGTAITLGGSGTITANTTQTLTLGSFLTGTSFNGGTAVTAAVDATSANTASKVVARDASGNFSAGTITATLSGAATTAGTVTTAAQPNITSVGTLTSLSVSGGITNANITTGANTTAGSLTGNWTLTTGSRLQATYADLAEKYVADASYEPGTVLVFGGESEVTIAHEFDSHRVAGVVSTNPAYVMNSGCQGEHVVDLALQGRVPVKVHGPVAKGDLMVSGPNGYAVANNMARAGTIIGKALQNFSGDHGVIEIVVGRV